MRIKIKERIKPVLWDIARIVILAILFYLECVLSKWLFGTLTENHFMIVLVCVLVLVILYFIGCCCCSDDKVGTHFTPPNWDLITNFFENTVSAKFISVVILLFFLLHLQLVYNTAMGLFMSDFYQGPFWKYLCLLLGIAVSIYLSLFLYPRSQIGNNPPEKRKYMICGLSSPGGKINPQNIDLLLKPFTAAEPNALKTVIVIPSCDETALGIAPWEDRFKEYIDCAKYNAICNRLSTKKFSLIEVINEYIEQVDYGEEVKERIKEVEFHVMGPANYDNYSDCVKKVYETMEEYAAEMKSNDTLLYISPGTGAIGSALSAFAIPGLRQIAYFPQNEKNPSMKYFDVRVSHMDRIVADEMKKNR